MKIASCLMDCAIGEQFMYLDKKYQCVEDADITMGCATCALLLFGEKCHELLCGGAIRDDGKYVHFEEVSDEVD